MTAMLLPLGQAPDHDERDDGYQIHHAGHTVTVDAAAFLMWHACHINPIAAANGHASTDTLLGIARTVSPITGITGDDSHLLDGLRILHRAGLLTEIELGEPQHRHGSVRDFLERHRLVRTSTDRGASAIQPGYRSLRNRAGKTADVPVSLAHLVKTEHERLAYAYCDLAETLPSGGQAAILDEITGLMPLIVGMQLAYLERVDPPPEAARWWVAADDLFGDADDTTPSPQ